jgi:1-acyl-sn-glycerol-3-phosphate acyltransferase
MTSLVEPRLDLKYQCSTLVELLQFRALQHPDRTAFIFLENGEMEAARLTYSELDRQANAIAQKLRTVAALGDRALLVYPSGLEFISAFFGCLYAGIIAVPVYPPRANQNLRRLQTIVTDSQASIALTSVNIIDSLEQRWGELEFEQNLVWYATDQIDPLASSDKSFLNLLPLIPDQIHPETIAFLQYTSGSTGNPKGVMVSHGNVLHNQRMIEASFGHDDHTVSVGWLPLFHDMGLVGNILQPLYLGQSCTLMSPVDFLQKPIRWLQAISNYGATSSGGPNFAYDLCVNKVKPEQLSTLDLTCWQVAFSGAEPVQAETLERFSRTFGKCGFSPSAFHPCYGMAEATLLIASNQPGYAPLIQSVDSEALAHNQVVSVDPEVPQARRLVSCGTAWLGQTIAIVDPVTRRRCQADHIGEIWVQGDSVALGYWNHLEKTQETFQATLQGTEEGPFLRTGDLGFIQNGNLFITGRLKDVIILRGRNYYPQDIELTLENSHRSLRKPGCCAAFSIDSHGEERLIVVAEVERRHRHHFQNAKSNLEERRRSNFLDTSDAEGHQDADAESVIAQIRQSIAQEHGIAVSGIQFLRPGSIPKTSSGKIQRHACRAGFLAGTLTVISEWSANSISPSAEPTKIITDTHTDKLGLTLEQIQFTIIQNLKQRLNDQSLTLSTDRKFEDYGFDSVEIVSLIADIEDYTGILLTPDILEQYPTIDQLSQYLEVRIKNDSTSQSTSKTVNSPQTHPTTPSIAYRCGRSILRTVYRYGFNLQCEGLEHIPQDRPFILAANHASHLDSGAVISALQDRVDFVSVLAAQDYFFQDTETVGSWQKNLHLLPFDRQGNFLSTLHDCQRVLGPRQPVLIFPEGTRSTTGALQPFQAGLGLLASRLQIPIVPVAIKGTFQALPKGQTIPRRHPIEVRFGKLIEASSEIFVLRDGNGRVGYQEFVNRIQSEIEQLLSVTLN